jgi:glycosyltransferase involved in cell wall biosynthesis
MHLSHAHKIYLISFEKVEDWVDIEARERIQKIVFSSGIAWHPLRYHKQPSALATAWDIFCGISLGFWLVVFNRVKIIHARSYVASVMALTVRRLTGIKYVFDMRGFWADERVDGGLWSRNGLLFRTAKNFEKRFLLAADHVVSLTYAARYELQQFDYLQSRMPPITVIPTCTDLGLFKPDKKFNRQTEKDVALFKLGYVGSVNVSYLFDETLLFFKLIQQSIPNARLHILNRNDHDYILKRLKFHQIDPTSIQLEKAEHGDVASAMNTMDAGVFFIKKAYSKIASAPTKLGEFLGCGIPCIGNSGVGDMANILEKEHVGVAIKDFNEHTMREAVNRIITLSCESDIKQRCRKVAIKHFSLELGVTKYNEIYKSLLVE